MPKKSLYRTEPSSAKENCIFCAIAATTKAADVIYSSDTTIFFRDIAPKAPVHILGIPRRHIASASALVAADDVLAGQLLRETAELATKLDISNGGFRIIINNGSNAGQAVDHLHVHLLGGEPLGPMKC